MKKSLLIRIHEWIGSYLIGDIEEIRRRTGVNVRHDFYWPRNSLFLEPATNLELVERLMENEVRRKLTKRLALIFLCASLPLSILFSSGIPALAVGVKTATRNVVAGAKNLTNYTTSCSGDSDDSLKACQQSLRAKSNNAQKRIESFMADQTKMNAAYALVEYWRQIEQAKQQGATPEQITQYEKAGEKLEAQLTPSEISELKSVFEESNDLTKQLNVINAKLKVNYYKKKAQSEGLTDSDNKDYQAQIVIIKNN